MSKMSLLSARMLTLGVIAAATVGVACRESAPSAPPAPSSAPEPNAPGVEDSPDPSAQGIEDDAGAATTATTAAETEGPQIAALFLQTPIMSEMEWPKDEKDRKPGDKEGSVRIGYIRQGAKVPVIPEPHKKSNCKDGWYELMQGGFVCGRYATLNLSHPRVRLAPHAPEQGAPLPYKYGYNVTHGTPLYRSVPPREDRVRYEPWLAPKKKAKPKPVDQDTPTAAYGDEADAGSLLQLTRTTTPDTSGSATADKDETPWYLRDYDGGKPTVTLDDLRGDGPIARRMVKGFYLALDKEFSSAGTRWWRTTGSLIAPHDRVYVQKPPTEFHGVWLNGAKPELPAGVADTGPTPTLLKSASAELCQHGSKRQLGFVLWHRARKYTVDVDKKTVSTKEPVSRFTVVELTGERVIIKGHAYEETTEGWWMRGNEGTKTSPSAPPADLKPGEKWVDVNVNNQTLVAFEGEKPVFATAVSTGRRNKADKERDYPTPPGSFRIREKHIAATMDGDVASDGPYSIEDVPWIMYFKGSYALHGAFWHGNFGRKQSHGCVNLAPLDARAMFNWTEPRLPPGWHGVWATPEKPGTRVVVHGE
jgi:lipoprotein-anchoring transpeptidase ErfK/SrfK